MKRILPLLLIVPLTLGACGGGNGFEPSPELLAVAGCVGLSLEDLVEIYNEVGGLVGSIGGVIPPNATYDIATGAFTITISFGTIAGVVTSPDNIDDGLDPGEQATATWDLNGGLAGAATVTGEGAFTFARTSSTVFTASGNVSTVDGTCELDVPTFNLADDSASSGGPVGTMNFTGTAPAGTLDGSMTFDGSDIARITATFMSESVSFRIDLNTFLPIF